MPIQNCISNVSTYLRSDFRKLFVLVIFFEKKQKILVFFLLFPIFFSKLTFFCWKLEKCVDFIWTQKSQFLLSNKTFYIRRKLTIYALRLYKFHILTLCHRPHSSLNATLLFWKFHFGILNSKIVAFRAGMGQNAKMTSES